MHGKYLEIQSLSAPIKLLSLKDLPSEEEKYA